jgi:inosine/xanthosine triphosphate pyrophosphatase family protein
VPSVITFVTGNAKKRKEVEEILLTYQTSFELVAEKVRGVR